MYEKVPEIAVKNAAATKVSKGLLDKANPDEMTHFLTFAQTSSPADPVKLGLEFAKNVLDPHNWLILRPRVGAI